MPAHRRLCKPRVRRALGVLAWESGSVAAEGERRKVRVCLLHIWCWRLSDAS